MRGIVRRTRHHVAERVQRDVTKRDGAALKSGFGKRRGESLIEREARLQAITQLDRIASERVDPVWVRRPGLSQRAEIRYARGRTPERAVSELEALTSFLHSRKLWTIGQNSCEDPKRAVNMEPGAVLVAELSNFLEVF